MLSVPDHAPLPPSSRKLGGGPGFRHDNFMENLRDQQLRLISYEKIGDPVAGPTIQHLAQKVGRDGVVDQP